jgi:hypothetical protein
MSKGIFPVSKNSDNVTAGEEYFNTGYLILKDLMIACSDVKLETSQEKYMDFQEKLNNLLSDNDFFILAIKFWNGTFLKDDSLLSKEIQRQIEEEINSRHTDLKQKAPDIDVITNILTKTDNVFDNSTNEFNIVYSDEFKKIKKKLINFIEQKLKETTYTYTQGKQKIVEEPFKIHDGGIQVIENNGIYNMKFPVCHRHGF